MLREGGLRLRMRESTSNGETFVWGVSKHQTQAGATTGYRIGRSRPEIQVDLPAAANANSDICNDKTYKEKEACQRYLVHGWISR